MSAAVVTSLGSGQTSNLLQSVGDAYKNALDQSSGIPLFGVFLGAIVLAIGAFVLWFEMIIRDAAIYICVFFLPLTFVGMIWPATSRWARRLVELLVAIILSKFVIVAILSLASAAITNTERPERRQRDVRADDRGRCTPRPRSLVAVRASPADSNDGNRRRQRHEPARIDVQSRGIGRHPDACRIHATGDGQELTAVHFTGQRNHGRDDVLAVAFDRAERRADGQRPARRIGDARDARRRFASRALVELVRWHRLPDGPAARRDNLSWLPARFRDPDRFAARVGHAFASSDATAPTPRAAASE